MAEEIVAVRGSELPSATMLLRDEQFLVIQGGVTKILPIPLLNELLTQGSYLSGIFTDADVVDGVLTLNHGLNTTRVVVFISDPNGENEWVRWKKQDANTITINFGGPVAEGNYEYIILYWIAGSEFNESRKFKRVPIPPWNMTLDRHISIPMPIGLTKAKIMHVKVTIIDDADNYKFDILGMPSPVQFDFGFIHVNRYELVHGGFFIENNYITLVIPDTANWTNRVLPAMFYATAEDRGYIDITFTDDAY